LYSCIASELRNFSNEYFIWNKYISSRGAPLQRGARGNCPRCPPLNPALSTVWPAGKFHVACGFGLTLYYIWLAKSWGLRFCDRPTTVCCYLRCLP